MQIWRYRKLLNMLAASRGAGTSCITLIMPPRTLDLTKPRGSGPLPTVLR